MALAGHTAAIRCATSDTTGDLVDGIMNCEFSQNLELLLTTDFADTSGAQTRIAGLLDGQISISGDYERADTGQARFVTNLLTPALTHVRFLPDGSNGFKGSFWVQDAKINATVDGKVEFSATLIQNGAITVVTP